MHHKNQKQAMAAKEGPNNTVCAAITVQDFCRATTIGKSEVLLRGRSISHPDLEGGVTHPGGGHRACSLACCTFQVMRTTLPSLPRVT
jgi:hypothetical protein